MVTPGQCLSPDCPNKPFRRGLCQRCYVYALDEIESGRETNDSLADKGLILRKKPPGPQMSQAFKQALAGAKR